MINNYTRTYKYILKTFKNISVKYLIKVLIILKFCNNIFKIKLIILINFNSFILIPHRFESHQGHKNLFFTFYFNRVECEEVFCKTNIKLLKLIKIKY